MNKKQTEHLLEVCDSILDLVENFSPHNFEASKHSFMFTMMYDMMLTSIVVMQNTLYLHHDMLEENEIKNTPPTLDTHTAMDD